jgi:hypothetical protein
MIFFASIKSNVNLTGLWFFTPLSFSLPFIFLYVYLWTEGLRQQNNKMILSSLAIMLFLIPVHSISVLFIVPIMIIYSFFNLRLFTKKARLLSTFLIIPILGVLFYKYTLDIPWSELISHLSNQLQFKYGWGVLEVKNSLTEIYSLSGYLLALLGAGLLVIQKKFRAYSFYLIWPLVCLLTIIIYRVTGVSYFSPYQRNLYYFVISLPLLSALGLYFISQKIYHYAGLILAEKKLGAAEQAKKVLTINFHLEPWQQKLSQWTASIVLTLIIILTAFNSYYVTPPDLALYHVIEQNDYQALNFLASLPTGPVMATPLLSAAIYPLSKQQPVANLAFYGNVQDVEKFFLFTNCQEKEDLIKEYKISYIISPAPLNCPYKILYAQGNKIIYQADGQQQ